jgi:hypothetical protein
MRERIGLPLALLIVAMLLASTGCKIGREKQAEPTQDRLTEGESLGSIDRLPGGTPVATDVRTLLSAECANERLTLRTNVEQLRASLPCERMLPASIVDQFIGKPVAIRYEDERLKVSNDAVGVMELPSSEPEVEATDAAP